MLFPEAISNEAAEAATAEAAAAGSVAGGRAASTAASSDQGVAEEQSSWFSTAVGPRSGGGAGLALPAVWLPSRDDDDARLHHRLQYTRT